MPIPTADHYDKEQSQNTSSADHVSHNASSQDSSDRTFTGSGDSALGSSSSQTDRPLSEEEADRLYEERIEEEYAKREGGA
ncbi:hypothetical protein N7495_003829 [Penicillium taxi]|uniref:uncharacterized protein n=1 Tax=Penicillium taxi TaxID=168475 RepID=UPI002544EF3E|nr:uncharacterized protein N7495_003829 [Penicillium taxi]KAJ5899085.1 hypothetical protein N7495_003829 [Penicillium taxi]